MKSLLLHTLLAVILLFFSCKKIDLPVVVEEEEPVFKAEFELDTNSKRLEAGVGFWYMGTSYEQDASGVYIFSGSLEKRNCAQNCREALAFHIRDAAQTLQGTPDIEQALWVGNYPFTFSDEKKLVWVYDSVQVGYRVKFDAGESKISSVGTAPQFHWEFGDSKTGTGKTVVHDFPSLDPAPVVTLSLMENNALTCLSTQSRSVLAAGLSCKVHIETWKDDLQVTNLIAVPAGQAPFYFEWDAMPQTTQTIPSINVVSGIAQVKITDKAGCIAQAGLQLTNPAATAYCSARFTYQVAPLMQLDSQQVLVPDPLQFSSVTIAYTDEDGTTYRSDLVQQDPLAAMFEVISVENYEKNEKGEKTKKLNVRFSCRLAASAGQSLWLKNGLATIAVAYP